MKYVLASAIVVLSLACLGDTSPIAAQQKNPGALAKIMEKKLKSSQTLLEGIAINDFAKITRSAEDLIQLSNTAEWFVLKTPRFEMHSNEFRRAAETIVQKAKDKNLDGVALAYLDMTMTCIRCHRYVREVRDARLSAPAERFFATATDR
jgi:cytochrome c556